MGPIFWWFTAALFLASAWGEWQLRLIERRKLRPPARFDSYGIKSAVATVVFIGIWVTALKFICLGASSGGSAPATRALTDDGSVSMAFGLFIVFGALVATVQCAQTIGPLLGYLSGCRSVLVKILSDIASAALVGWLVYRQVWAPNEFANNLFMLLIGCCFFVPFAFAVRRSGLITLLLLIMALDVYLVWHTGATATSGWYVRTITSDIMQHWPLPVMVRAGRHGIGGGDILLATLVTVYALRHFGVAHAVLAGLLMSAPIVLKPIVALYVQLPSAFPYTIFIAPVGLFLTCYPQKRNRPFRS